MPRTGRKRRVIPWSATDVKQLRRLAGKEFAGRIARTLRRSEGATRQKALALKISLRMR
jgi:hypothetical protein